jgi:hypothetical protein
MSGTLTPAALARLLGRWNLGTSPAYRELADVIRLLVLDGRVPLAVALPSERSLAGTLGVSRTTVTNVSATVDYTTLDGTALAGLDYIATNGTLSYAAGETNKSITVALIDDVLRENTELFTLRLWHEPTLLLFLGRPLMKGETVETNVHAHHDAKEGIDIFQLFAGQRQADIVETESAILLGNGKAKNAEFPHLRQNFAVKLAFRIPFLNVGSYFALSELADHVADLNLLVCQLEVHIGICFLQSSERDAKPSRIAPFAGGSIGERRTGPQLL